ncbi:MAG: menaquinol-cytochrome C reductase, partial [Planifilum fimeticola]
MSEEEKERRKKGISRRKFLTYTLGGTGGFLASVMLYPMVRF